MSWTRTQEMQSMARRITCGKITGLRNLKQIREEHQISQKAMAEALGADLGTYRGWEQERYFPNARWLPAIAAILECSIADLF